MTTLLIVTACASPNSTSISTMPLDERNAKYAASKSDVNVCRIGTTSDGEQWETSVPWFKANANESMSRGLSLKDCNNLTKKNKSIHGLGFYSYLLILVVLSLTIFGTLNLTEQLINENFPKVGEYVSHLIETLNNLKIIFFDIFYKY